MNFASFNSWYLLLISTITLLLTSRSSQANPTPALSPITVQLKWVHQAQFAGFYVAAKKGFYADENLDVTFNPGGAGVDILDEVLSGRADFGLIGAEHIILNRSAGNSVKAIATTYRINPFVLVTMPESGILSPEDFKGHVINAGGTDGAVQFKALLTKLGMNVSDVDVIPYNYDLEPFYQGKVDITIAFSAGSLIGILKSHPDVNVIWPIDYGIHFYSDTLFTTDSLIASDPDLVLRFLRATLKGHQYALENLEETVEICMKYAADPDIDLQKGMLEASVPLIYTGQDEIGWMRPEVWEGMYNILAEQGLLEGPVDLNQVYTLQFLEEIYRDAP